VPILKSYYFVHEIRQISIRKVKPRDASGSHVYLTRFMCGNVSEPSGFTNTQRPFSENRNRLHISSLLVASAKRDPMMRHNHNSPYSRALQRKSPIIHERRLRHGLRFLLIQNADAEYTAYCAGNLMPYLLGFILPSASSLTYGATTP
jgi:hypothetical protein